MRGVKMQPLPEAIGPCHSLRIRETPNNASAAGGIGSCGIILDAGAAENALRPWKRALYWAFQGRFLDQDRVRA